MPRLEGTQQFEPSPKPYLGTLRFAPALKPCELSTSGTTIGVVLNSGPEAASLGVEICGPPDHCLILTLL